MNKHVIFIGLLILVSLFSNTSFAQKTKLKPKHPKPSVSSLKPDSQGSFFGEIEGNDYKNSFFGLKLTVPENWIIQEKKINEAIKQAGIEKLKGKTSQVQQSLDKETQKVTILFTISKDIFGIANNAILLLATEKIAPLVQVRNGYDYMRLTLQSYKSMQLPPDYKYSEKIQSEKFGNENFSYIDIERTKYTQRIYATYRKGYAVFFTLQFFNTEDLDKMRAILQNADFAWKP